jgi:hypothetical protein
VNSSDELWLAIAVKDYGTQKPRDAEMLQQAIEKLEARYGESLELGEKPEAVEFAGARGQRLAFKGQIGAVVAWGECTLFAHHGFAYWVFLGGPSLEDLRPFETELTKEESGFSLVTERSGWREQPVKTVGFTSSDGEVSVSVPEGVWEKSTPPNVDFDTGTLLLFGRYLKEKDNQKNAHLQIFVVQKQADLSEGMKEAIDYLTKRKKNENSAYKLVPAVDEGSVSDLGTVEDVGNRKGRVAELKLARGDASVGYYVVAVVSESDHLTVVLCECNWKSRQIWRQDFLDLLKTFKANAKAAS